MKLPLLRSQASVKLACSLVNRCYRGSPRSTPLVQASLGQRKVGERLVRTQPPSSVRHQNTESSIVHHSATNQLLTRTRDHLPTRPIVVVISLYCVESDKTDCGVPAHTANCALQHYTAISLPKCLLLPMLIVCMFVIVVNACNRLSRLLAWCCSCRYSLKAHCRRPQ